MNLTPSLVPTVNVIGSRVAVLSFQQQINTILYWAAGRESRFVCVANTHMLIEAHRKLAFWSILQSADLVTPDGMPLVWMMKLMGVHRPERVAGMDILLALCHQALGQNSAVFFVGSQAKILGRMKSRLEKEFPGLNIVGMEPLPFGDTAPEESEVLTQKINESGANLVFVSLGCPKQEYWMVKHKNRINAVMIGLGGVFPIYAGIQKHAPKIFRKSGLEWLYRLSQEPRRLWKRYASTIPIFVWLASKQIYTDFLWASQQQDNVVNNQNCDGPL